MRDFAGTVCGVHAVYVGRGAAACGFGVAGIVCAPCGRALTTRPIKGTRPRDLGDPARDAGLREELLASAKDHAELTMIVDLLRNDLGRVSTYGSVEVTEARRWNSTRRCGIRWRRFGRGCGRGRGWRSCLLPCVLRCCSSECSVCMVELRADTSRGGGVLREEGANCNVG